MSKQLNTQKISLAFFAQREDTVLAWLGMAGVLVNARGTILLIDPLIATVVSGGQELCEGEWRLKVPLAIEAKDVPRVDAVLYTHADGDHFGRMTAEILAGRLHCRFIAPPPVGRLLSAMGIGQDRITVVSDYEKLTIGQAEITVTPALHNWQEKDAWERGDCCGYLIKTPDGAVWHPGDSQLIPELLSISGVDVLFFDVAVVEAHLGPAGSAELAKSSGAKVMVAYHYGTFELPPGSFGNFNPEASLPYVAGLPAKFLQLNPGELLKLPLEA
jgi:L-ascorbate metabolism protein UlaG (beta-lactamase superfamily)